MTRETEEYLKNLYKGTKLEAQVRQEKELAEMWKVLDNTFHEIFGDMFDPPKKKK